MKQDEIIRLTLTYGADPTRWPPDVRAEAERFIQSAPEFAQVLRGAAQLDAALMDQRSHISDDRLDRLKSAVLARTGSERVAAHRRVGFIGARVAMFAREWSWAVAGFASAVCVLVLLQLGLSTTPVEEEPIVSLLEYDSGLLEMIR